MFSRRNVLRTVADDTRVPLAAPLLKKMVADSNAAAQDSAIECLLKFVEAAECAKG